jgi:hypothetical protein
VPVPVTMRKQVYELTVEDLRRTPVWEFALDEEGVDGQDEATVRPRELRGQLDPADGMMVLRARFVLADGSEHVGYVTPPSDDDTGLGVLQPVIVGDAGQVVFWHGTIEPTRAAMDASYRALGKTSPSDVFPIRFHSDVPLSCGPSSGAINGFLVVEDMQSGRVRELR